MDSTPTTTIQGKEVASATKHILVLPLLPLMFKIDLTFCIKGIRVRQPGSTSKLRRRPET